VNFSSVSGAGDFNLFVLNRLFMTAHYGYQSIFCKGSFVGPVFLFKHLLVFASKMKKLLTSVFRPKLPVSLVVKSKYLINHYKKYYGRPIKTPYAAFVRMGSNS